VNIRRHLDVSGIVQGVGFRPYIYRLARERRLAGAIHNTSSGVSVEIEGTPELVEDFLLCIRSEAPPLARITEISVRNVACRGEREFRIVPTRGGEAVRTLISPDVATCADCVRELLDPKDRRYRYAFINCTNCGPRFTITRNLPYDRPSTSMAVFPMCAACQAEYDDPLNRRFHAQPNACWECGPKLEVWNADGGEIENVDPIRHTISRLRAGEIVAIKGLGGFHLAADATNRAAIARLRERKRRVEKPFAIMVGNLSAAAELCEISPGEARALQSIERPIVLVRRKANAVIADQVAPFNRDLGIFLPYTPVHHLLFAEGGFRALVMTSGNLSEEPIAIDNREALRRLERLADCFLVHDREILLRSDDSVVRVLEDAGPGASTAGSLDGPGSKVLDREGRSEPAGRGTGIQQLRRSRGFVPVPIFLHKQAPSILAVGGQLKNTICLTKNDHAFLSQHVGDLENLDSCRFFEDAIEHLETILEIKPQRIACDLHPDYFSTKWAVKQPGLVVGVQHHHAHVASCMAENHLDGEVIGIALDGTGYGTDGHIWGGEVLIANYRNFQRAAHFEYIPMPGGEAAIREPWRMAVSYLGHNFPGGLTELDLPILDAFGRDRIEFVLRMIERRINSPLTSSCGRLFDAVAALAGIRQKVNYEAQAAIELEMAIGGCHDEPAYPFELYSDNDSYIVRSRPLWEAILRDVPEQTPVGVISARFHNGLVDLFRRLALILRERTGLCRVCLSGGTFNNRYLTENLYRRLRSETFEVFTQRQVPAGDGGISLGQAMVAAHRV